MNTKDSNALEQQSAVKPDGGGECASHKPLPTPEELIDELTETIGRCIFLLPTEDEIKECLVESIGNRSTQEIFADREEFVADAAFELRFYNYPVLREAAMEAIEASCKGCVSPQEQAKSDSSGV